MILYLAAALCFDPVCFGTITQAIEAPKPIATPFLKAGELPFLIKLDGRWYPTVSRSPFITVGPLGIRAYGGSMTNCRRADGSAPPFSPRGFYYGTALRALYGVTGQITLHEHSNGYLFLEVSTTHGDTVCEGETTPPPPPGADLIFHATAPATAAPGGAIVWAINGNNGGPAAATGVSMTAVISNAQQVQSAAGAGWACTVGGIGSQVVNCTRPSAPQGVMPQIIIVANANSAVQVVTMSCTGRADQPDPEPENTAANCTTATAIANPTPPMFRDGFEQIGALFADSLEER